MKKIFCLFLLFATSVFATSFTDFDKSLDSYVWYIETTKPHLLMNAEKASVNTYIWYLMNEYKTSSNIRKIEILKIFEELLTN